MMKKKVIDKVTKRGIVNKLHRFSARIPREASDVTTGCMGKFSAINLERLLVI